MLIVAEQTTDEVDASRDEIVQGYLRGLAELACQTAPNMAPVRDETRIREVLRGEQRHRFWRQLRKMVGRKAPPRHIGWGMLSHMLLMDAISYLYIMWRFLGLNWIDIAKILPPIVFAIWFHRHADANPRGIVTFGDLARHLAAQEGIPVPVTFSQRMRAWVGRTFLRDRTAETNTAAGAETSRERTA